LSGEGIVLDVRETLKEDLMREEDAKEEIPAKPQLR
jgi:hypothetical protein